MPYEQFDDPLADPLIDQRALAASMRGSALPFVQPPQMSMAPGYGGAPQPAAPPAKTREQREQEIYDRINKRPDGAQYIEQAKKREEASNRKLMLALTLGSMGGESMKPFAAQLQEHALKESTPYEIPGGWGTATPEGVVWNEQKQREADLSHLQFLSKQGQEEEAKRLARIDAATRAQERNDVIRAGQENTRAIAAMRHQGGSGGEKFQRAGMTPDGRVVSYNTHGGGLIVDGQPYNGPMMSQAAMDKQAGTVQESLGAIRSLKDIDAMVAKNPNAFGGVATLSSLTPQIIASRWQAKSLTPEERQTRAMVMTQAAQVINDLYGAAVSAGEMSRAQSFVPTNLDDPLTIAVKLKAAQAWANSKASAYGPGMRGAAEARGGGSSGAWAPPPGVTVTREK